MNVVTNIISPCVDVKSSSVCDGEGCDVSLGDDAGDGDNV